MITSGLKSMPYRKENLLSKRGKQWHNIITCNTNLLLMPLSNDNQDYSNKENKEKNPSTKTGNNEVEKSPEAENKMTTDDLKGKQQVDADLDKETDRAAST